MDSSARPFIFFSELLFILHILTTAHSQLQAPPPSSDSCNGIFLSYSYFSGRKLPPTLKSDPKNQPYRFESTITIQNNGLNELKSWAVFVGFRNREYLVSASNAVLADGTSLPADVNNTVFAGYPTTDLKTAAETAGDLTQMQVQVDLVGTQFGVAPPAVPMPSNISLANDGFLCPKPTLQGKNVMYVCCMENLKSKSNSTLGEKFLPRKKGDLTIMYDVIRTYESDYWAQVTIENHSPLGRLDNWKLSWDWMRDEFIYEMKGAYPSVLDSSACIYGPQGEHYKGIDFSNVLNCERRPTITDLPPTKENDTTVGKIQHCCRNGTVLPPIMDPGKSTSAFQIHVFKMPPDVNRSLLFPPQNWKINGTLNPDYICGPPVRVSPSLFPDPNGFPSYSSAIASWQVSCNITHPKGVSPRCCVSFSAYYNESVIPCETCACGCSKNRDQTCSTSSPAMFLPTQALLVPSENRTTMAVAWANLQHRSIPKPLPCGDNCGVSINWHLYTDYRRGWSARITLFNWGDTSFADWFTAVQLGKRKAGTGFEAAYSFNASLLSDFNNTIFMQGLPGLNYLVAEADGADPTKDTRVPGKQQTVISFTKNNLPGVNIAAGDGFPTKVFFNGEECSLPVTYPTSGGRVMNSPCIRISLVWLILCFLSFFR